MVLFESPFDSVPVVDKPFGEIILSKIWQHAIKYPRKKAIICAENEDQYFTYSEIYLYSLSVASFLEKLEICHGNVAAFVMPNNLYFAPIFIGCALRGVTITAASMSNTHYELERQFTDASAKIIFCSKDALENVLTATKNLSIKKIIIIDADKNTTFPNPNIINFFEIFTSAPLTNLPPANIKIETDALMLPYSSGTTGTPKGVIVTHKGFGTHANVFNASMETFVKNVFIEKPYIFDQEHELLVLPIYHMFGCCTLFKSLMLAKTIVLMKQFEPEPFFQAIEKFKIRMLIIHPPVLIMLSKHPSIEKYDLSSIEIVFSSASAAGKDIIEEIKRKHPNLRQVTQCYGATESLVMSFPDSEKLPNGSNGKVAPLGKMRVVDVETGAELSYNQPGEILYLSPVLTPGYLNKPEATKESIDSEGWYHTGDFGYLDEEGNVFIIDRMKEVIKVEGLTVSPAELEDVLLSHSSIADAAVIGILNGTAGEVPKAYIVRKDANLTEAEVMEFVKERVAYFKQLTGGVEFINEIPKNASGKILRRVLREQNHAANGNAAPILTVYHLDK
uniref:Uncharacterized protein n=1 Tax=Panagrolaimus sp. ES5 TaxID=591445 RepID=A0AC34F685_9BILA